MRKVKLKYQHVMSIITHYYSNILKSSRDNNKKKNEVTSGLRVYKVPRVLFKPALCRMYVADQEPSNRSRNQLPVRRTISY